MDLVEGEEQVYGTQRALGSLEFLTQDAEPSVITLVDTSNGFNKLIHFAMLWTVQHRWLAGATFRSTAISIGRNFSSASRGRRQLQS